MPDQQIEVKDKGWLAYFSLLKNLIENNDIGNTPGSDFVIQFCDPSFSKAVDPSSVSTYNQIINNRPFNGTDIYLGSTVTNVRDTYVGFLRDVRGIIKQAENPDDYKDVNDLITKINEAKDTFSTIAGLTEAISDWENNYDQVVEESIELKSGKLTDFTAAMTDAKGSFEKGIVKVDIDGSGNFEYRNAEQYNFMSIEIKTSIKSFSIQRSNLDWSWIDNYRDQLSDKVKNIFDQDKGGLSLIPTELVIAWRPQITLKVSREDGKKITAGIQGSVKGGISIFNFDIGGNVSYTDDGQTRDTFTFTLTPSDANHSKPVLFAVISQKFK